MWGWWENDGDWLWIEMKFCLPLSYWSPPAVWPWLGTPGLKDILPVLLYIDLNTPTPIKTMLLSNKNNLLLFELRYLNFLVEVMEFQLRYFNSWKMMLWKCCTQHASKFGKLSSGHKTGKGPFSFQSQRKAMPKNVWTTTQLHSSHTLVKWCSKFSKPGFSNMWTVNFQMFKLVLEKSEEPEIKLPTSAGSLKKQESSRKTLISALCQSLWLCGSK